MTSPENIAMQAQMRNTSRDVNATIEQQRQDFVASYAGFKVPDAIRRESIKTDGVDAEWFRAGGVKRRALLFFHGGGYVFGSTISHQALIGELAATAGVDALGVNYRLAPEHPFPAAIEDAAASYRLLLDHGYMPEQIAFAGDSAGGGIVAALVLALKEHGLPQPACALLISPWLDLTNTLPSITANADLDPIVTREGLEGLAQAYLGVRDRRLPLASPLHGDWHGAPPLYIQVGSHEILLDDSCELAKKAQVAGVDVKLEIAEGCVHVYPQYSQLHPEGIAGVNNAAAFIREKLRL